MHERVGEGKGEVGAGRQPNAYEATISSSSQTPPRRLPVPAATCGNGRIRASKVHKHVRDGSRATANVEPTSSTSGRAAPPGAERRHNRLPGYPRENAAIAATVMCPVCTNLVPLTTEKPTRAGIANEPVARDQHSK